MPGTLDLGTFSISLTVADLHRSQEFYERLGFEVTGGAPDQNYLVMVNGTAVIGLFHAMFDRNILTFNPGLTLAADGAIGSGETFTDVREIQARLQEAGLSVQEPTDPDGTGPAHITLIDPDGNPILIDQFGDRPAG